VSDPINPNQNVQVRPLEGCIHTHHIVAVGAPRAETARAILASVGMTTEDGNNGVFLPCEQHVGLHTYAYYDRVNQRLSDLPVKNYLTVAAALATIRAELLAGARF
jgi:hypothetical protein